MFTAHQGWKRVMAHEAVNANSKKVWQTRNSGKEHVKDRYCSTVVLEVDVMDLWVG